MVFHTRFSGPPSDTDVRRCVDAYSRWEYSLDLSPRSYRAHRSQDSYLELITAQSIDPSSYAVQYRQQLKLQGLLSNLDQLALPAAVTPLISWHAPSKPRTKRGRTYAVCLTPEVCDGTDNSRVSSEGRLILAATFSDLIEYLRIFSSSDLVLLQYQRQKEKLDPAPSFVVTEASCDALTMSTQCRRMVPGRG